MMPIQSGLMLKQAPAVLVTSNAMKRVSVMHRQPASLVTLDLVLRLGLGGWAVLAHELYIFDMHLGHFASHLTCFRVPAHGIAGFK